MFSPRYARLGLARVRLSPEMPLDPERVQAMLKQQGRVVVFFSLTLLLAPVVESLVLLDRMIYLQENGESLFNCFFLLFFLSCTKTLNSLQVWTANSFLFLTLTFLPETLYWLP